MFIMVMYLIIISKSHLTVKYGIDTNYIINTYPIIP